MRINRRSFSIVLASAAALSGVFAHGAQAAATEIVYSTFLDPTNERDPRAAAQTHMIEAFEKANPDIKVKLVVDPTGQTQMRAMRSHADKPDVVRITTNFLREYVATGNVLEIDDLLKRDKIDQTDWLRPLDDNKVDGKLYSLPQDYRIPILIYRKSLLEKAGVTQPPTTWDEACTEGKKANRGSVMGYPVPIGAGGGHGGAEALGEFYLDTMLPGDGGNYFTTSGEIAFPRENFLRAAQTIKDLFGRCGAAPQQSVQMGFNEIHDGLRAGTVAMTLFGLYRFNTIRAQGAGDDLGWAPPTAYTPTGKQTIYGFQLAINRSSKNIEPAWRFVTFMTSPEGQAIQGEGGEVVARASAYKAKYFTKPDAANQLAWAELVKKRGQLVTYSPVQVEFNEIVGEAFQRMILQDGSPEDAYTEVVKNYEEKLARSR
ncbi:hypothetical protein AU467_33505 [Mesorhizobium loti]|uniref:ABC transporter substrate-binding protein n=1 Tax=Rhizobium loti TaxID=381 RepID=A0A124GFF0_RHILI|nr:hypothetical protein AU467_33505 [Mesorhizobium loti]